MKICEWCSSQNPDGANYCMRCGHELAAVGQNHGDDSGGPGANWPLFWLTLGGSLVLSWLLMVVFHLPVFILGAILPLVWFSRKK